MIDSVTYFFQWGQMKKQAQRMGGRLEIAEVNKSSHAPKALAKTRQKIVNSEFILFMHVTNLLL